MVIMIFIPYNALYNQERLHELELDSRIDSSTMELCCLCKNLSSFMQIKKRKLLHRDSCTEADVIYPQYAYRKGYIEDFEETNSKGGQLLNRFVQIENI